METVPLAVPGSLIRQAFKETAGLAELLKKRRPGPRILIYHQVGTNLGREMELSTSIFETQLSFLRAEGEIVSLDQALDRTAEPGSDRLFVLTFDDGYQDMYENAFPILAANSTPFTVYFTTQPMNEASSGSSVGPARPLTWHSARKMNASGLMTVGAHTHSHPDLRFLAAEEVASELDTSNRHIQQELEVVPEHFCYPKGWWAAEAEAEISKRYRTATLGEGPSITPETNPLRIHRVAVQKSDGVRYFKKKLATGLLLEDRVRRRLRDYEGPPEVGEGT